MSLKPHHVLWSWESEAIQRVSGVDNDEDNNEQQGGFKQEDGVNTLFCLVPTATAKNRAIISETNIRRLWQGEKSQESYGSQDPRNDKAVSSQLAFLFFPLIYSRLDTGGVSNLEMPAGLNKNPVLLSLTQEWRMRHPSPLEIGNF